MMIISLEIFILTSCLLKLLSFSYLFEWSIGDVTIFLIMINIMAEVRAL